MGVGWLGRLLGEKRDEALPLWTAVVQRGRQEHWYLDGAVPDSVDGRFDMIAAVLSLVLIRLEADGEAAAPLGAQLTERFVDDMDGQLRQMGIGDIVVGKHIGKMMSMLGGRIGAYREGLAVGDLKPALARNLYRAGEPPLSAITHVADALTRFHEALGGTPLAEVERGSLP
ncbi:MAG: ubiquinol-cytochrome C chaperone family protein [Sphingomonas bacterium]|nr:ubiquinol-cytochrome C chaperone family protein [Sphingomonas bacterium]